MSKEVGFERIAVVGSGSMGTNMSLLFAEKGHQISLFDIEKENVDGALKTAEENSETKGKIKGFHEYEPFVKSLPDKERLFVFSITHGPPADEVLGQLKKYLQKGDIIIDGGNEWYLNTRRREKEMKDIGVGYIGTGVSGGYQSARRGPSLSPGGEQEVVDKVMPFLQQIAARDTYDGGSDEPCVLRMGPEGSGHYVKMVHNGIEQGELSGISETFELLNSFLGYSDDEISKIFGDWASKGELKENFLIEISSEICSRRDPPPSSRTKSTKDKSSTHTLDQIQDKVVQDADNSEGTGFWTVSEAAQRHVSLPTVAAAHFMRVASAERDERIQVSELFQLESSKKKIPPKDICEQRRQDISVEDLRLVTYAITLAAYVQGLNLLARTSLDEEWNISLANCIKIWRAGCIIRSSQIANFLQPLLEKNSKCTNILLIKEVTAELKRCFPVLKKVVLKAIEWDAHTPAITATLEWIRYCASEHLPTNFEEAMLDYFGAHSYDLLSEGAGSVKKGKHHTEWKPA